jgi:hypothetical protein
MRREVPDGTIAVARIVDGPPRRIEIASAVHGSPSTDPPIVIEGDASDVDVGSVQAAERLRAHFQPLAVRRIDPPTPAPVVDPAPLASADAVAPSVASPPRVMPPVAASTSGAPGNAWPTVGRNAAPNAAPDPRARDVPRLVDPPLSPEHSMFGGSLGIGMPIDVGGVGFSALASGWFSPIARFRIEPFVSVPLVATSLEGPEGSADLYAGMVGAMGNVLIFDGDVVDLSGGAGLAGIWLRTEGEPRLGYRGTTEDVFMASPLADVSVRFRLTEALYLAPRAFVGAAFPTPNIHFDERSVEKWGLPWGMFALSMELEP